MTLDKRLESSNRPKGIRQARKAGPGVDGPPMGLNFRYAVELLTEFHVSRFEVSASAVEWTPATETSSGKATQG